MKSISSDGILAPHRETPKGVPHFKLLTSGSISSTELGCQSSEFNNQLIKNTSDDGNSDLHRETHIYVHFLSTSGSISNRTGTTINWSLTIISWKVLLPTEVRLNRGEKSTIVPVGNGWEKLHLKIGKKHLLSTGWTFLLLQIAF